MIMIGNPELSVGRTGWLLTQRMHGCLASCWLTLEATVPATGGSRVTFDLAGGECVSLSVKGFDVCSLDGRFSVECDFNVIFSVENSKMESKRHSTVKLTSKLHIQNASVIDPKRSQRHRITMFYISKAYAVVAKGFG
jgi:hypothetical protein